MRRLCGLQWRPAAVTLARARPQQVTPYRDFFRAPVRFGAPRSALVFPARILEQPNAGADPDERTRLSQLAAELDTARPGSVTERTLRALSRMVIAMPPSGDKVAEVLGIKRRRLRERLEAEGSSIKGLLEVVRCELARQLLEQSRMPISEIAATLHYSQPGAFSRAFKGWTGKTPRQWRTTAARTSISGNGQLDSRRQRILQQHRDGHRPHATRHGRDGGRDLRGRCVIDVADELVVRGG
jgi:AraC-like DNA-binding protein